MPSCRNDIRKSIQTITHIKCPTIIHNFHRNRINPSPSPSEGTTYPKTREIGNWARRNGANCRLTLVLPRLLRAASRRVHACARVEWGRKFRLPRPGSTVAPPFAVAVRAADFPGGLLIRRPENYRSGVAGGGGVAARVCLAVRFVLAVRSLTSAAQKKKWNKLRGTREGVLKS